MKAKVDVEYILYSHMQDWHFQFEMGIWVKFKKNWDESEIEIETRTFSELHL
jgi:hypothetical protein